MALYILRVAILTLLIAVANASWGQTCKPAGTRHLERIKELRFLEEQQYLQEEGPDHPDLEDIAEKIRTRSDVHIEKSFSSGSYVLAEHSFTCCFEGFIALYEISKGGQVKQLSSFNGYDEKGKYIGFEPSLVRTYFRRHAPSKAKPLAECWK